jgi:hypothetical protein
MKLRQWKVNTIGKVDVKDKNLIGNLATQFESALIKHNKKMGDIDLKLSLDTQKASAYNFNFKMHCKAPHKGVYDKNV